MVCYCAHSVERFILWLRRRYGSLEVLNRRWGRNYQAWEEIEPPRCAATFNDMVDWREFFGETLAEELHKMCIRDSLKSPETASLRDSPGRIVPQPRRS